MTVHPDAIVIPSSSPEQNWARSVSPCTPERLLGLSSRSPSPVTLISPSDLYTLPIQPRKRSPNSPSPLREDVGRTNLPINNRKIRTTTTKEGDTQRSRKEPASTGTKPKTTRTRKSAKPEAIKNKTITGRVAKGAACRSKAIKENEDTPIASEKRSTSQEAKAERNEKLDDLNLEEAIKRRLDWTPPKSSPFLPLNDNDGHADSPQGYSKDPGFRGLLHDYRYSKSIEVADNQTRAGENVYPTKRRRIELVEQVLQEPIVQRLQRDQLVASDAAKGSEKPRARSAAKQKKARTITALVTSRYEPVDEHTTNAVEQYSQHSNLEPKTGHADDGKKTRKQKSKKATTKIKEPEYIVLSPEAVNKSLDNQDLLFGTCSQLETDDSPTLLRETQRALAASENHVDSSDSSGRTSTSVSSGSIALRFTGTKSLWSAATRNSEGFVVQPEILDMTNSPAISSLRHQAKVEETDSVQEVSTNSASESLEGCIPSVSYQQKETNKTPSDTGLGKSSGGKVATIKEQVSNLPLEMPRFNGFTDDELRKQVASYGFKSIKGRDKMIALLKKCWLSKHRSASNASKENPKTTNTLTDEVTTRATKKQAATKQAGRNSRAKKSDPGPKRKSSRKQFESCIDFGTETAELSPSTIPVEEIADSEDESAPTATQIQKRPEADTTNIAAPTLGNLPLSNSKARSTKNKANNECPDLYEQITKAIRSQPRLSRLGSTQGPSLTWHEKMLLYDPVLLEDLAAWLNTEGLGQIGENREVGAGLVREWCESKGVCCTYRAK